MAPNNLPLASSESPLCVSSTNMATAGISPVSSPLPTNNHAVNHHGGPRCLPRTPAVSTPQSTRLNTQQQQQQQQQRTSSPNKDAQPINANPQTPRVQISRQASHINSTTPVTHVNLYSTGGEYPPRHTEQSEASPTYFNLTFNPADSNSKSLANVWSNASSETGTGAHHQLHTRTNWSPPSSRVRSTAAPSPRVIPVDQNPEFEAFRRQSELRGQKALQSGFGFLGATGASTPPTVSKLRNVQPADDTDTVDSSLAALNKVQNASTGSLGQYLVEEKPRSPKRTLPSPYITDRPRRLSPAAFSDREAEAAPVAIPHLPAEVRFSLPPLSTAANADPLVRAETLPGSAKRDSLEDDPFATPSHIVTLIDAFEEEILLLDLRVQVQYSRARIRRALNLCIPPLLLKRPTYNTKKLADSLKDVYQKRKFEQWRNCKYIVVYDANSSKVKDAAPCLNMLKKFENEGWKGGASSLLVMRGGFQDFAKQFPTYVTNDSLERSSSESSSEGSPTLPVAESVPPVIGGCPMPAAVTRNPANPFFGNIRQNMDLIGGVGQIEVKVPRLMIKKPALLDTLPPWLRNAAATEDAGREVAAKFLAIEKQEQKRMQEALSETVRYSSGTTPGEQIRTEDTSVKLAGIEKGTKNRYDNIWPYEHSRVKLEGVCDGECDYVNANYVKASWSNKRYIATQGPIPTTFSDFWNVVWQQDVRVIVMLTAETEGGQVKAHNYWNQRHFGPLTLTFLSEHRASLEPARIHKRNHFHRKDIPRTPNGSRRRTVTTPGSNGRLGYGPETPEEKPNSEQPYVIVRRFTLSSSEEPFERMREITHLQYSHWPDFGAPAHPAHLLGLVEQCDAVVRAQSSPSPTEKTPTMEKPVEGTARPVLVHCSAGCGRTGTFCTVDSVLDMMRRQKLRMREKSLKKVEITSPMEVDMEDVAMPDVDPLHEDEWVLKESIDLVEKTVRDFRLQRLSMVQSLRQFVLCYETVLEWLAEQAGEKSV